MTLRFDGRVAVITGAGGGLGREYARLFARLGASVVVNDLGVSHKGDGSNSKAADLVVDEIRRAGGKAVANYDSVENGPAIIKTAINNFGRIDILINNAGILRDVAFKRMTEKDWDMIMLVHMKGSFSCSRAAWPYMQEQKYGRIVNTASASGLYGNFGQVNYAAAKMGLVGFSKALAIEGQKNNILVNCIAPLAGTRMTETILPKEIVDGLRPEYVSPIVAFLSHESCNENGGIFECGAGWVSALRLQRTKGMFHPAGFGPDDVKREWHRVTDFASGVTYPSSMQESMAMAVEQIDRMKASAPASPPSSSAPAASAPVTGPVDPSEEAAASELKSYPALRIIRTVLETRGADIVKKQKRIFQFDIKAKSGKVFVFTVNLKEGKGAIISGPPVKGKPDAKFAMSDDIFLKLLGGDIDGTRAMLTGKMRVSGNLAAAANFTPEVFHPELRQLKSKL